MAALVLAGGVWVGATGPAVRADTPLPGQKEEKRGDKGASAEAAKEAEMLKAKGEKDQPNGDKKSAVAAEGPEMARIDPAAKEELSQIKEAYAKLSSLELKGSLKGNFDVAGEKGAPSGEFSSSFQAPNKFRHQMRDVEEQPKDAAKDPAAKRGDKPADEDVDVICGSTGTKAYAYQPAKKVYVMEDVPKGSEKARAAGKDWPSPVPDLLEEQNPVLLLALSDDAGKELAAGATEVTKGQDAKIGEQTYSVLKLVKDERDWKVLVDPKTHLVRQVEMDLKRELEKRGAPAIKVATLTFDYPQHATEAAVKPEQFAWSPPEGAKNVKNAAADAAGDEPAMALQGKPAPEFVLPALEGKDVDLKDLKGSVVVLDFWATWCGPCVQSLPHLDKLYQDRKDKGLKVFALNQEEEKAKVQEFVTSKKLTIPVLLDVKGDAGEKYKVSGIPQTVVVGKDGKVKKVFIGFGPGSEDLLAKAVDAAMAE
jgi:peroxiredoxin